MLSNAFYVQSQIPLLQLVPIASCAFTVFLALPSLEPSVTKSGTVIRLSPSKLSQVNQSELLQPFPMYYTFPPNDLTFFSWENLPCAAGDPNLDAIFHVKSHKCQTNGIIYFTHLAFDSTAQNRLCLHC